jgi:hypothetical protein
MSRNHAECATCAQCGISLAGRRPQARYCGGPCRAAASRARSLRTLQDLAPNPEAARRQQTAQKRTHEARGSVMEGAMTAALVLDGLRAMNAAQREELRDLLGVGVHDDRVARSSANDLAR